MKKLLITALMTLVAGVSMAQTATSSDMAAKREAVKNMTPEQKAEKKKEMKAKWDAMTPEEREAAKKAHPRMAKHMAEKKAQ